MRNSIVLLISLSTFMQLSATPEASSPFVHAVSTTDIDAYIEKLLRYPNAVEQLISRSYVYFPIIEEQLDNASMPEALKFLAVIESSLEPKARSEVGAVGLWQLMPGTARDLGLKVTSTYDERKDPFQASRAAIRYLQSLYDFYGDWTLCIAAYNTGPGNVNKAIRRADSYDFDKLKRYLPRQTQNHITRFAATKYLFDNFAAYNLNPTKPSLDKLMLSDLIVTKGQTLGNLATIHAVDLDLLRQLNPAIEGNYVKRGYRLNVPTRYLEANVRKEDPYRWNQVVVPADMTLVQFATLYQVSPYIVRHVNTLKDLRLYKAQQLLIPSLNYALEEVVEETGEETHPIYHSQDLLPAIAQVSLDAEWLRCVKKMSGRSIREEN